MRLLASISLAAALVALSGRVEATDLEAALALEAQGRLVEALEAFEGALVSRGNSPSDLVTIYQHLGMLRFAAGDQGGAREALMRLRALDREAQVPALAPPEVESLLEEISAEWGARTLGVDVSAPAVPADAASAEVSVRVLDDLANLVAGAQVRLGRQVLARAGGGGPYRFTINLSALSGVEASPVIMLLDEHDGVLLERDLAITRQADADLPDDDPGGIPRSPRRRSRGTWVAGWALLATGLASGITGAVLLGLDGNPTGVEREVLNEAGEVVIQAEEYYTAPAGWALLGVGAALIATSIILLVLSRRQRSAVVAAAGSWVVARW